LFQFLVAGLTSRDEQRAPHLQDWQTQFGNHWEWAQGAGGCNVESLPSGTPTEILEARMHDAHVPQVKPCRRRCNPIHATLLGIYKRELDLRKCHGERQPREAGPGTEIDPSLMGLGWSNRRKTERVVDVALTQACALMRTKEPPPDRFEILTLEPSQQRLGSFIKHRRDSRPSSGAAGLGHPDAISRLDPIGGAWAG
jgi:hypothetical protein